MTIFDVSGIEAYVEENNPKFINALIRKSKALRAAKGISDPFDPYKAAYRLMPTCADADFFKKHPLIKPSVFLGDPAFDVIKI